MTTLVKERDHDPEPPRLGIVIAVALEPSMVAVFAAEKSWLGLFLCVCYAWFSATWSMLERTFRGD